MKTPYFILFLLPILLVACAEVSEMKEGIVALEGKNISEATRLLGEPTEIKKGTDFDSYIWDYQSELRSPSNVRTTSSAAAPGNEQAPESDNPTIRTCYIKFEVDKNEIIKGWHYKGDQQGCGMAHTQWIQKLKDYAKSHSAENKAQ